MSKIAMLVIGSYAPLILDRVVTMFDERFQFFLHLDQKQDLDSYTAKLVNLDKIRIVQKRVKVYWGGFSMVEAEIALIREALADPDVTNLVLLSDDSAPVISIDSIHERLVEHADRITCVPNGRSRSWYEDFYYTDSHFAALRGIGMDKKQFTPHDFGNILKLERLRIKGKKRLETMYFGRQWWALSRSSAAAIISHIDQDEHLVESFRFSLFPDEIFFPTVYRLCFPTAPVIDIPTYADYGRHIHPWQFSSAEEIQAVQFRKEHMFVRKIKPELTQVIDDLAVALF